MIDMVTKFSDFGNLILNTDSYKHSHHVLYPPNIEFISSYIEARGGAYPAQMFVGLQAFIKEYLMKPIGIDDIDEAEIVTRQHKIPFNRDGWLGILNEHDGYLPVEIEALPEGSVYPLRTPLVQIVNTDPKYFWVTSFVETALLRAVWYPTSVGTLSWMCKQLMAAALAKTSDHPEIIRDLLHDYGARGVSSQQSAALGGMAHLVCFQQTDTMSGSLAAQRYYNAVAPGVSGPNSEHSTMTSWGSDNEVGAYENAIDQYSDWPFVVIVSDSYDLDNAIRKIYCDVLREKIQSYGGAVFVRPDSGDPVSVVCDSIESLMDGYGHTVNSKGYRVLPDCVKLCQGDGITLESLREIYAEMDRRKLAADNVYFGMGGGLLQHINRDTMHFAMKANAVCIGGSWTDIWKSPNGVDVKASKPGRLGVVKDAEGYRSVPRDSIDSSDNLLKPIFRNGKLLIRWDFTELIARSEEPVPASYYESVVTGLPRSDVVAK